MTTIIIAILLAIFVVNTLWQRYKPFNVKSYFKKQFRDLDYQIADLEFKRFKTKEGREELRQQYTEMKSKLEVLENQMKDNDAKSDADRSKLPTGDRARLDDDKVRLELQIKRTEKGRDEGDPGDYVLNLKDFDTLIAQTNSQIDQIRSLKGLLEEYISQEI